MKLFYSPASPFARKVLMYAHETQQEIETVNLSTSPTRTSPEILAVNPLGKIPALQINDTDVLYDSRVICQYLDANQAGPSWYGQGDVRFWIMRLEALADGLMDAALSLRYEITLRPKSYQWDDWKDGQLDKIKRAIKQMDFEVTQFDPELLNMAQIAIAASLGYLDYRFDGLQWREEAPNLAAWYSQFSHRESFKATQPDS